MLDMKTILLTSVISNALITVFIALLWHQNRKRYAGLSFWLTDYVLQMLGITLLLLRNAVPDFVSIIVAQTMIIAGALSIYMGLERFVHRQSTQIHNYIALISFVLIMSYFTFVLPDIDIRTLTVNIALAILTLQCAWLMIMRVDPSLRSITRGVGLVFLIYAFVALVRSVDLLFKPFPADTTLFGLPEFQVISILIFQMLNIALTFALILMVTRRLARDVQIQELNYASLYNSMQEGIALHEIIYTTDDGPVDYRVLDVNPAYETIFGMKRKRVVGRTGSSLYGADFARRLDIFADVAATRCPVSFETYIPSIDKHLKISVFSPGPGQFGTVFQDVTESKRAAELIRVRLTLLEFSVTHSLDELLQKTLDEVGAMIDSPIGFYHFVDDDQKSLTLQAWSTRTAQEFCKAEGRGMHYGIDEAGVWVDCVREKRPVIHNDYSALPHRKGMPEGHARVIRELVVPIMRLDKIVAILGVGNKPVEYTDQDISVVSYLADVAWEITRRKRAEEALKQSEEKFRGVFETSRDFTFISTLEGRILDNNEAARGFFGYSSDEIRAMNIGDFYANPEERAKFRETVIEKGYVDGYDLRLAKKDGTLIDSEVTVVVRKDADGNIVGFQGSVRDVTERRRMEQQLLQSEKLSTIGTMISGVAHELNNPLTAIIGNTQLLMRKAIPDEIRAKLNIVFRESKRTAGIVSGLLAFAREHEPGRKALDINDSIRESVKLREHDMKVGNVKVAMSLAEDLPKTLGDPFQFNQVFINLINNAIDAVEGKGRGSLSIKTSWKDDTITIEFEDDGPGIPKDVLGRIFDPFFTTKDVGKGTGLGLSMAYGILREHGGTISAESRPGDGAKLTVTIPITEGPPPAEMETEAFAKPLPGAKTVLVVEDEESLRNLLTDALAEAGLSTESASTGQEAMNLIVTRDYDAVVSDITIPGIDVKELFSYIQKHRPHIAEKIIFITGDFLSKDTRSFLQVTDNRFIEKPFNVDTLVATLGDVLSA
jgi:PAS domain S-box-containing protein